ncbi:MAG: hypothetical protein QM757_35235 [Paludibaculum sp.]
MIGVNGFFNRSQDQIWILPLPEATVRELQRLAGRDTARLHRLHQAARPLLPVPEPGQPRHRPRHNQPGSAWATAPSPSRGNGSYTFFRYDHHIRYQSDGITDFAGIFQGTDFRFDEDLGDQVNGPPPWHANLGLDVNLGRLFASAIGRYVDGRTVFSFANNNISAGQVETQHVDAYMALDLSFGIDCGAGDRGRYAKVAILDVFDSSHSEWWHASSTELTAAREDELTSDIGRMVTAEVGWLF